MFKHGRGVASAGARFSCRIHLRERARDRVDALALQPWRVLTSSAMRLDHDGYNATRARTGGSGDVVRGDAPRRRGAEARCFRLQLKRKTGHSTTGGSARHCARGWRAWHIRDRCPHKSALSCERRHVNPSTLLCGTMGRQRLSGNDVETDLNADQSICHRSPTISARLRDSDSESRCADTTFSSLHKSAVKRMITIPNPSIRLQRIAPYSRTSDSASQS